MTSIHKLRRGCLWLLAISGIVVFTPIAIAIFFFSRPSLHSTEFSPDGRFKMEIWLDPMFVAMPGSGGDSNKSGTVYVSNTSGFPLGSATFDMLMNLDRSWETDKVNVSGRTWDLPKSDDPNILLFHAAMRGNYLEFTKLLPKANLQFRTSHNRTFIHAAVIGKNLEIIEQLLQKKVDVNAKDKEGDTALQLATEHNSIPVVKLLLKYGADAREHKEIPGEISSDGRQAKGWQETPLLHALEYGYLELAQILIENGADVNVRNRNQASPLQLATGRYGYFKIVGLLVAKGADINAQDSFGNTALFTTISSKTASTFSTSKFLIQRGAKVNIANTSGQTPLMIAANLPDEELSNEEQRQTTQKLRTDLIQLLMDNDADVNAKDKDGKTAFDLTNDPIIRQQLQKVK
jgi:ankyrin repeat protein